MRSSVRGFVNCTDGGTYLTEIVEWDPTRTVRMVRSGFTGAIAALATSIDETWHFEASASETKVVRSFKMFPRTFLAKPALAFLSPALKRAVELHMDQLRDEATRSMSVNG